MVYVGYLIIMNGQNIKKIGVENFAFLSCQEWKIA